MNQSKNKFEIRGDVTVIFITRTDGSTHEAMFDTEDIEKVLNSGYRWRVEYQKKWDYKYVAASEKIDGIRHFVYLHRLVMDNPQGKEVDHINHNTLDNRKCNLRITTRSQNAQNRTGAQKNSKSGIRGVNWHKSNKKWRAAIRINRKEILIGYFNSVEEAERAVNEARSKYMTHHIA